MIPALIAAGASLAGGLLSRDSARDQRNTNTELQREFAQNGVRWKVEDAKAAGIHPLFAMGASTHSFNPVAIQDSMPAAVASMGQDISRAVEAGSSTGERAMRKIQLRNLQLQGDLLQEQIAASQHARSAGNPPFPGAEAFPVRSDGIVTSDLVKVRPAEITSSRLEEPSIEAGPARPSGAEYDFGPAGKWKLLGEQATEALEDTGLAKYAAMYALNKEKIDALIGRGWNNIPHLAYRYMTRPDWVKKIETQNGSRLLPFYRSDGKLYWKEIATSRRN